MGEVIVASKPLPGTGIWASDPLLVRNLTALARTQPEALPVIEQLEHGRLASMEHLARTR